VNGKNNASIDKVQVVCYRKQKLRLKKGRQTNIYVNKQKVERMNKRRKKDKGQEDKQKEITKEDCLRKNTERQNNS
jgi:hypothetical protein